ncbi:FHA domain-containing protein [Streptomyces sp. 3MP-14]|uniref:FHA domain-containing protein n=1 Tax=Streptomyces mimosae TaxID=2586635 RepID=A0A5N6APX6_9ACTN|nr:MULTISPECIES: FHA domain-containing protein [Streptomyces]KAB8169668.1 FHA domain-containing protein [Streptomyces mimosae]KAB8178416.1 FHA domain-containing protein [Streptomyces sp. 3MP-14]
MPTCPNGHQSMADDWCEVCGHRIMAPAVAMPPPPPAHDFPGQPGGPGGYPGQGGPPGYPGHPGGPATAPMPAAELCPQCRTPREAQAPFCEECRYNFLTNSPTTYTPPAPAYPGAPQGAPGGPPPPPPGFQQQPGPPPPQHGHQPPQPHQGPPHQGPPHQGPSPQAHQAHLGAPQAPPAPGGYPPPQQTGDWMLPPPGGQPAPQPGPPGYPGQPGGQGGGWLVSIGPDPEYFTAMMHRSGPEAAQLTLPAYAPEQQLPLTGPQVTIGRRRNSTGEAPDIDLSRQPEDPGVSHQHAVLVEQPDGGWAVVDQDSTNGTTVNGAEDPIQPFVPVPLRDGDRVHVGAWTTLRIYRQ